MNHSWMSAIIRRQNSVENSAVFCPWSSLRMSACTVPRTFASAYAASWARSSSFGSRDSRSTKASTCWSIAVLRKKARTVGAGPLMVSDTDVVGATRSNPSNSSFMSSSVATETPDVPTLP